MLDVHGIGVVRFQRGGGYNLHDIVDAVVGLLQLHSHDAHDVVHVCGMGFEFFGGGFNLHIYVEVIVVGECGEPSIHRFNELYYGFFW